jgi:hypothetical protein
VAHAGARDAAAAKDLHGIVGHLERNARRLVLEQRDRSGQKLRLLLVAELCHLVRDVLEPVRDRLAIGNHGADLGANDGLLDERFAKDNALVGPLEALCKYQIEI